MNATMKTPEVVVPPKLRRVRHRERIALPKLEDVHPPLVNLVAQRCDLVARLNEQKSKLAAIHLEIAELRENSKTPNNMPLVRPAEPITDGVRKILGLTVAAEKAWPIDRMQDCQENIVDLEKAVAIVDQSIARERNIAMPLAVSMISNAYHALVVETVQTVMELSELCLCHKSLAFALGAENVDHELLHYAYPFSFGEVGNPANFLALYVRSAKNAGHVNERDVNDELLFPDELAYANALRGRV